MSDEIEERLRVAADLLAETPPMAGDAREERCKGCGDHEWRGFPLIRRRCTRCDISYWQWARRRFLTVCDG